MSIDATAFRYVSDVVGAEASIVVGPGKEYLVESRLLPVARELGVADAAAVIARLRQRPDADLRRRVVEAMTTNETSFFRDRDPFRALGEVILPELRQSRVGQPNRRLSIWSAACSTGQEPYSIAISLLGHSSLIADRQVDIVATDINSQVLERARAAEYSQLEVNRGLPAANLVEHFEQDGRYWRPVEEVRRMVRFKQLNLAGSFAGLPTFDIVFLRNVLIYFDAATRADVLRRVRDTMAPDGYLILGGAETLLSADDGFRRAPIGATTAYRLRTDEPDRPRVSPLARQAIRQRSISRPASR